jgi:hypothetical protein
VHSSSSVRLTNFYLLFFSDTRQTVHSTRKSGISVHRSFHHVKRFVNRLLIVRETTAWTKNTSGTRICWPFIADCSTVGCANFVLYLRITLAGLWPSMESCDNTSFGHMQNILVAKFNVHSQLFWIRKYVLDAHTSW